MLNCQMPLAIRDENEIGKLPERSLFALHRNPVGSTIGMELAGVKVRVGDRGLNNGAR